MLAVAARGTSGAGLIPKPIIPTAKKRPLLDNNRVALWSHGKYDYARTIGRRLVYTKIAITGDFLIWKESSEVSARVIQDKAG